MQKRLPNIKNRFIILIIFLISSTELNGQVTKIIKSVRHNITELGKIEDFNELNQEVQTFIEKQDSIFEIKDFKQIIEYLYEYNVHCFNPPCIHIRVDIYRFNDQQVQHFNKAYPSNGDSLFINEPYLEIFHPQKKSEIKKLNGILTTFNQMLNHPYYYQQESFYLPNKFEKTIPKHYIQLNDRGENIFVVTNLGYGHILCFDEHDYPTPLILQLIRGLNGLNYKIQDE
jgi:hypothetical protein